MKLEVRQVTEVTDSLLEAFGRLMPQLSPLLEAPSAARLHKSRRICRTDQYG